MADDLQTNLETYLLQLQQVDAALISDPANDELIKLKSDLSEVIDLTKDLLAQQEPSSMEADVEEGGSSSDSWVVGGKCMAPWSQDGQYYEAVIEEIHPDGKVSVGFTQYSQGEITQLTKLKPYIAQSSKSSGAAAGTSGASKRLPPKESLAERKEALLKQKEYLKKRKQKKQARLQEMDTEREKEKKKWLNFSTKKGLLGKKRSIFASPETVDGRVGIGTCGVAGKGMTEFSAAEKWRKGWK